MTAPGIPEFGEPNVTPPPAPAWASIGHLFQQQAHHYPESLAFLTDSESITYGALNRAANRIAHALRARWPDPGQRFGLLLPLGVAQLTGFLGVLKAGHAVVGLDPLAPLANLRDTLTAIEPVAVLTGPAPAATLAGILPPGVDCWIAPWTDADFSAADPGWEVSAEALACLMFTSGSTGQPKGVQRTHRNLIWSVDALTGDQSLRPTDRLCFLAAPSTANGIANLLRALLRGATILGYDLRERGLAPLADHLFQQRATVFTAPSSIFRHFLQSLPLDRSFPEIRLIRVTSEPLHSRDLPRFRSAFPRGDLYNVISSTETGNYALHRVDASDVEGMGPVPIGRPLPGVDLRLVNAEGREVGAGEPGEITIASPAVAPGYWRQPELTAQAFRVDPASNEPRYHTGDHAIRRADGVLEFSGRQDLRVKIRGLGVDLTAVEAALEKHPTIREAAVTTRLDRHQELELLALVVPREVEPRDPNEIRRYLTEHFPGPMVPSIFRTVDRLPRTASGKLDRSALATWGEVALAAAPEVPARPLPATESAARVARIWEEILGKAAGPGSDNFYAAGGHSLSAMRLLARMQQDFGITLSVRQFLEHPHRGWLVDRVAQQHDGTAAPGPTNLHQRPASATTLPLSSTQQRLWFEEQRHSGTGLYHLPWALHLRGTLDLSHLTRCFQKLTDRHEILRTVFPSQHGIAEQVILPSYEPRIRVEPAGPFTDAERATALKRWLHEAARRPFDLSQSPAWRIDLLQLEPTEHVLLVTMHHLISDRWSKWVLTEELIALYAAKTDGRGELLPPVEFQFGDYVHWQQHPANAPRIEHQLNYWKQRLADVPVLDFPTDHPRPPTLDSRGGHVVSLIPTSTVTALQALAREEQVSMYGLLLAVFQVLCHRLTGQTDITVCTAIANRPTASLERTLGCFVNTLALRGDLSGNPQFREFLRTFWPPITADFSHPEVPFERLIEVLRPPRDPGRTPLSGLLFTLQNMPRQPLLLPGLRVEPIDVELETAHFDLSVLVFEESGTLRVRWEYRRDLFEAGTVQRLATTYHNLLQSTCQQPDGRLGALPLLSPKEAHQLLTEWNATERAYPRDACLPQLFEAQAGRRPEAVAVTDGTLTLTYRGLQSRSNQLAHQLIHAGVVPGEPVGLYLARSVGYVVAVLAVLKAGGVYVPLPTDSPAARLTILVNDAGLKRVLTDSLGSDPTETLDSLPGRSLQRLDLAALQVSANDFPVTAPVVDVEPLAPACILYTSGSSGTPRGVVTPHRAIVRLVCGTDYVPWSADRRFLLLAPVAFDATHFELWGALLHGARLAVFTHPYPDLAELETVLRRERIDCLFITTGWFNQIIDDRPTLFASMKYVLTGGEALSTRHIHRALECLPDTDLISVYGPTEATTFATAYPIPRDVAASGRSSIPLGRPIANTRCYVLDPVGGVLPPGLAGELYLGGDALALQYQNAPEETRKRFVPDPFSPVPGGRMYRTGDRCRWLEDGTLEFLGRLDAQLKINGHRVEPAEIEAALCRHPSVERAVVVAHRPAPGRTELTAVIVPTKASSVDLAALRQHLAELLPRALIPTSFEFRPNLPLTPHGKVDRKVLEQIAILSGPAREFPSLRGTTAERQLAELMAEVLGKPDLGIHSDFFAHGGHSLLALRLAAEYERRVGTGLRVADIFHFPTAATLAAHLTATSTADLPEKSRSLRGVGVGTPLFHIPGRFGFEVFPARLAELIGSRRPYCDDLQFPGVDGRRAIPPDVREIAADLVAQIESRVPRGPLCLSGHSWGGVVAWEVARELAAAGRVVEFVLLFDSIVPGSARRRRWTELGPVLRQRLHSLPPGTRRRFLWELARNKALGWWHRTIPSPVRQSTLPAALPLTESAALWSATEAACASSQPGPSPIAIPVILLQATQARPNEGLREERHPTNGWGALARGPLTLFPIPTHHSGVFKEPIHPEVFRCLSEVLSAGAGP